MTAMIPVKLAIALFLSLPLLSAVSNQVYFKFIFIAFAFLWGFLRLIHGIVKKNNISSVYFLLVVMLLTSLGAVLGMVRLGPVAFYHWAEAVSSIIVGFLVSRQSTQRLLFYSRFLLFFYFCFIIHGILTHGIGVVAFEQFIPNSSTNYVTGYLIILQIFYSVIHFLSRRSVSLLTPFLTFLVGLAGYGRSGVIISGLILLFSVITWVSMLKNKNYIKLFFVIIFLISVVSFKIHDTIFKFILANTKLGHGIVSAERLDINEEYVNSLSGIEWIVGGDYSEAPTIRSLTNNPHNSYIRGHYLFGAFYLLGIFISFFWVTITTLLRWSWPKSFFISGLVSLWMVRALVDTTSFPTLNDFIFYTLCFLVLRAYSTRKCNSSDRIGVRVLRDPSSVGVRSPSYQCPGKPE